MLVSISSNSTVKSVGFYLCNTDVGKLLSYTYELLNSTFHLVKDSDMRISALKAKSVLEALQPTWKNICESHSKSLIFIYKKRFEKITKTPLTIYGEIKPDFKAGIKNAVISIVGSLAIMKTIEFFTGHEHTLPIAFSAAFTYASVSHVVNTLQIFSGFSNISNKCFGCRPIYKKDENESFYRIVSYGPGDRIVQEFDKMSFLKGVLSQQTKLMVRTLRIPIDQALPLGIGCLTYCAFPESNPMGATRMLTESVALALLTPISTSLTTIIDNDLWPMMKQIGKQYYLPNYSMAFKCNLFAKYLNEINDSNGSPVFPKDIISLVIEYFFVKELMGEGNGENQNNAHNSIMTSSGKILYSFKQL